jgi:Ras-related protein Rab-21
MSAAAGAGAAAGGASAQFKVVLLGEGRVGKTCVCLRYVQGSFTEGQESTIQATYLDKRINVGKTSVKLLIWDTAGQERFHALGPIYYRDANGAVLVYDITDRESFTKVRHWVKELRKIVGKEIVLVILGNKMDLEKNRQVNEQEAKEYADSVGAVHVPCSAKTGKNIDAAFLELTKGMLKTKQQQQQDQQAQGSNGATAKSQRTFVQISNDVEKENTKGPCC